MSALDIKLCSEELRGLKGAWFDKIYQIGSVFLMRLRLPKEGRKDLIIEPGRRIHLTSMDYAPPKRPTSFAMLIRKHLKNTRLSSVEQPDFERIIEFYFGGDSGRVLLVAELFGSGNLILCDGDREIIMPLRKKFGAYRKLKPDETYVYPPKAGADVRFLDERALEEILADSEDLVKGLARNLNIGGHLAEEICARTGINKHVSSESLSHRDYEELILVISDLLEESPSPLVVIEDGRPIDVLPFPFRTFEGKETKSFESFNEALDFYFGRISKRQVMAEQEDELEKELEMLGLRLEKQEGHLKELEKKAQEAREKADAISAHHKSIDRALERLEELRRAGGWEEVKKRIEESRGKGESWMELIDSVQPRNATIKMNLPEESVTLDLRLSAFENASNLYDRHKRLKAKAEGAREAISETELEIEKVRKKGVPPPSRPAPQESREREWFERYRWFYSSDDMLVIGGRDVATNQEIVEKHMEPHDLYFHADIKGAPHVIVKTGGGEVSDATVDEAARFAAMHSRAWRMGLGNIEAYWVRPEQISKKPPSGEYLPKGSYMVRGKRNFKTVPLEAAVGYVKMKDEEIPMCGPPSAVESHSTVSIRIKPGGVKKSNLAHKLQERLKGAGIEVKIDDLMRVLPPGKGMLVE